MPFDKIQRFTDPTVSVDIFYLNKVNRNNLKIKAYEFTLNNDVKSSLKEILQRTIDNNRYKRQSDYTIDLDITKIDNVYKINADEVYNFRKIKDEIDNCAETLNIPSLKEINPNMYVINFVLNTGQRLIGFTSYKPTSLLKGKKIIFRNGANLEIFSDNVLSIKNYIDCLYLSETNEIFIFNKPKFETIFNYKEDYRFKAQASINKLAEHNLITGLDILADKCLNNEYMIKKLAKIYQENKIDKVNQNFNKVIGANNSLGLNVNIDTVNQRIIVSENADRNYISAVLSLLNTEPTENIITGQKMLIADQEPTQLALSLQAVF